MTTLQLLGKAQDDDLAILAEAARSRDPTTGYGHLRNLHCALEADRACAVAPELLRIIGSDPEPLVRWQPEWRCQSSVAMGLQWCGDEAVSDAFLDALETVAELRPRFATTIAAQRRRNVFRREMRQRGLAGVPVVSLGLNCMAFELPQRFGFGIGAGGRTILTPFAFGVHKRQVLLDVLQQGWASYAPLPVLALHRSTNGETMVIRRDGGAVWNHHRGAHMGDDEFRLFRESIGRMSDQFDAMLERRDLDKVIFLLVVNSVAELGDDVGYPHQLLAALDRRSPSLASRLLVIATPRRSDPVHGAALRRQRLAERITLLELPIPREDYVWWEFSHHNRPDGLGFEFDLAQAMAEEIAHWSVGQRVLQEVSA